MVRIGGISSPKVALVGKRHPPAKKKAKGVPPAVDTRITKGKPTSLAPWMEQMDLSINRALIHATIDDDSGFNWDLAGHALTVSDFSSLGCLDDNSDFNGDFTTHTLKGSELTSMGGSDDDFGFTWNPTSRASTPSGSESSYNFNELCSMETVFNPVVECAKEKVNDIGRSHAIPSTLPPSKLDMGYSVAPEPISSHTRNLEAQRLPFQQPMIGCALPGHDSASASTSDSTKQGSNYRTNQEQAQNGWSTRDTKQGSNPKKFLKKKYPVILGRDFLLIDRKFQSSLKTSKAFHFFHRPSTSPVEIRGKNESLEDPMNCDYEAIVSDPSTIVEKENEFACGSTLMSVVPQYSNIETSSTRIDASLLHHGSVARNLKSKRIMACQDNDFENIHNHDSILTSTQMGCSSVENLESKLTLNASGDGGYHVAHSADPMPRPFRSIRIRAFRDCFAKEGCRHMNTPSNRKAHRKKSRLQELDDAKSVQAFSNHAQHKHKREHTIEDSCNDPHVFRLPQRRLLN